MTPEQVKWSLSKFGGKENIERVLFNNGRFVFPDAMISFDFDNEQNLFICRDYKPGSGYIVDSVTDYAVLESISFKTTKRINPKTKEEIEVEEVELNDPYNPAFVPAKNYKEPDNVVKSMGEFNYDEPLNHYTEDKIKPKESIEFPEGFIPHYGNIVKDEEKPVVDNKPVDNTNDNTHVDASDDDTSHTDTVEKPDDINSIRDHYLNLKDKENNDSDTSTNTQDTVEPSIDVKEPEEKDSKTDTLNPVSDNKDETKDTNIDKNIK